MVNQRLLTVSATFRAPAVSDSSRHTLSKLCSAVLLYGDRASYINGLDDILFAPVLSMQLEFSRSVAWTDWKGVRYTVREAWEYVMGPASEAMCTPGMRDGMNPSHDA